MNHGSTNEKLTRQLAKVIKTEADLGYFSKLSKKIAVKGALDAELTDHLGYEKNNAGRNGPDNPCSIIAY